MRSRRRIRRIVIIVLLLIALAIISVLFVNYRATGKFDISIDFDEVASQIPPDYLYSFSGPDDDRLERPIGVLTVGDRVWVTDSRRGQIDVFMLDGERVDILGADELTTPLYLAQNPLNGDVYVSDRRTRSVHIFTSAGEYVGEFDPDLPEEELPTIETDGFVWAPVGVAFGEDGTLYVTEILKGHRLLIFDPSGEFVVSVGDAGIVARADESPEMFQFPNAVKVLGDEVWVADSNNRRMQVFSLDGEFLRILVTDGLPRGFDFLQESEDASASPRFAIVDTLAHDVTIWDVEGDKLVAFGGQGVLEGQFSYPNDISVDESNRIFVADTSNSRIQVWGWPAELAPIPTPRTMGQLAWCLSPLLLLPLLLLRRRKRFVVTPDFVSEIAVRDEIDSMTSGRKEWIVHEDSAALVAAILVSDEPPRSIAEDVEFTYEPHSESDAKSYIGKFEISREAAVVIALAARVPVFCTEDAELRRIARLLDINVLNVDEYIEKYSKK